MWYEQQGEEARNIVKPGQYNPPPLRSTKEPDGMKNMHAVQGKGQISKSVLLDNFKDGVDFTSKRYLLVR